MHFLVSKTWFVSIAARFVIALVLLCALLASGLTLPEASAGHLCAMACCIGKAPHEAGSCMHESCEVVVEIQPVEEAEPLCGAHVSSHKDLETPVVNKSLAPTDSSSHHTTSKHKERGTSIKAVTKPCPPDCKAGGLGYSSLKRQNDSPANGESVKQDIPTSSVRRSSVFRIARELARSFRPALPRGPPTYS
jgi:hypothetical protein